MGRRRVGGGEGGSEVLQLLEFVIIKMKSQ